MMRIIRKHNAILQELYQYEMNSGKIIYSTAAEISEGYNGGLPYIYYNDVYHTELAGDLSEINIY